MEYVVKAMIIGCGLIFGLMGLSFLFIMLDFYADFWNFVLICLPFLSATIGGLSCIYGDEITRYVRNRRFTRRS